MPFSASFLSDPRVAASFPIALLALPYLFRMADAHWSGADSSDGWLVLLLVAWMSWRSSAVSVERERFDVVPSSRVLLAVGVFLTAPVYLIGRSQSILLLEGGGILSFVVLTVYWVGGVPALKKHWLGLALLMFVLPVPAFIVQALTTPLKEAVSSVAANVMYSVGYPIARSGVILHIGPYQLLVADACSGLASIFTLEAMGIIYVKIRGYSNAVRNVALAILIVPASFLANTVRVILLALITYHFGDEVGQGFLHSFAGIVLFLVGFALMILIDAVLGRVLHARQVAH